MKSRKQNMFISGSKNNDSAMKEKIIIHNDLKLSNIIQIYDKFRIAKISPIGTEQFKLNPNKEWYACQVFMLGEWKYICEPDKTGKNPGGIMQLFETEKMAREYIEYAYHKQLENLGKLGIKKRKIELTK